MNLPEAAILFDHFHVIKIFNDRLPEFRCALYNEAKNPMDIQLLKEIRGLLLKNPENLNNEKDEQQRFDEALKLNLSLASVYYLKDDLRQFCKQRNKLMALEILYFSNYKFTRFMKQSTL